MQKAIIKFIKDKIVDLETGYAQNYIAVKELESKEELSSKDKENIEAGKFNMNKALEKIALYKKFLKEESPKKG